MRSLQPQAFGEGFSRNSSTTVMHIKKPRAPTTPFLKGFDSCWFCNRTQEPYRQLLPVMDRNESTVGSRSHKSFQLRFDIMVYALARYPRGFSRATVMKKTHTSHRTQQRILESLVREGFLSKRQAHVAAGAYYTLVPRKIKNMVSVFNCTTDIPPMMAGKFLPKFNPSIIKDRSNSNAIYQQATLRFDVCFDILTFAVACGKNGFTRKDVMQEIQGVKERSQQRMLAGLVQDGFLKKEEGRGNSGNYYINNTKLEVFFGLLNNIDV